MVASAAMPNLTPKVILEGTRLTFKTEIAFALNEHPRVVGPRKYRYHSPLSHGDVPRAADEIADWLERTGGLYTD